jgi:5-methylcytosine-specific restriction protein A
MPPGWRGRRAVVLHRDGYKCVKCGARATDVDHIKPRAFGGGDELTNLQSLCKTCHRSKTGQQLGHREAQL